MSICVTSSFFFSSRRRHTRSTRDWSSDVCSSDLLTQAICERQIRFRTPFIFGIESGVKPADTDSGRTGANRKLGGTRWSRRVGGGQWRTAQLLLVLVNGQCWNKSSAGLVEHRRKNKSAV